MTTIDKIKQQIETNAIILYMKGTPEAPQCGFSSEAVKALDACGKPYATVNVLENPDVRAELPKYANWPTFPQLYIRGDLVGGSDIISELYTKGQLQLLINEEK